MTALYNEIEPFAVAWLRELIAAGLIADGIVDDRPIQELKPSDVEGFTQVHFFAGIGGWSYALRLAGWPDNRAVWTGSCPCQPFSASGRKRGFDDSRHLWPEWYRLIDACRPPVIFGEQVCSAGVVGGSGSGVPGMSDRKAVFGVLQELQRQSAPLVPELLPSGVGTQPRQAGQVEVERQFQALAGREPRASVDERGKKSSQDAGVAVRPGRTGDSTARQRRIVRVDWNPIRLDHAARMERPLFGPDQAGEGVYEGEHASCSLCLECNGEYVGFAADCRNSTCDYGEAAGEIERLIESLGCEVEGENESAWFDAVSSDLERAHYTIGACDTPAAGFGAPEIRQRLFFVADSDIAGPQGRGERWNGADEWATGPSGVVGELAHAASARQAWAEVGRDNCRDASAGRGLLEPERGGPAGVVAHAELVRVQDHGSGALGATPGGVQGADRERQRVRLDSGQCGDAVRGFWADAEWIYCRDEKYRPVESGTFPLAHGIPGRVGRLRGYGNAIVPTVAKAFIEAYLESRGTLNFSKPQ
jgi:site-specific DNA-cytosine methylase